MSVALRDVHNQPQQELPRTKQKRSGMQKRKSAALQTEAAVAEVVQPASSPGDAEEVHAATDTAAGAKAAAAAAAPARASAAKPAQLRQPLLARASPYKGRPLVRLTPATGSKASTVRAAKPLLITGQELGW